MADEPQTIRAVDWKATFPFLTLFRGFRVAIHPSKLALALAALVLTFLGGSALDYVWPANSSAVPNELEIYGMSQLSATPAADFTAHRDETRKNIETNYDASLKAIGKSGGGLKDLKWDIVTRRDRNAKDIADMYEKLPAAEKTEANRAQRDQAIAAIYDHAAGEWQNAQAINGVGLFQSFLDFQLRTLNQIVNSVWQGNWLGENGVVESIRSLVVFAPVWAFRYHAVFFTIFALYKLCIWSIFGGALARIAAVHVARDEKISIRQALRFSSSKFLSFLSAPIIPMLIVLAVGLVLALAGFLLNIPFAGPIIIGAFFFVALIAGFVMTLVLLGTAGGFNLMYPTIAVEGSDSFDAISRSFSYLYARPWRMAFYTGLSILYGSICYLFVRFFLYLMLFVTHKFVGLFVIKSADNFAPLWNVMWPEPGTAARFTYELNTLSLGSGQWLGAALVWLWVHLAIGLLGAFAISFYVSANTIIYYLMRNEVDATELDDVYLEQLDDDFAESPPVGLTAVPATAGASEVPSASANTASSLGSSSSSIDTPAGDSTQA